MSTKSGRRSSIRELKPGASKKRSRGIETKTAAEAALATDARDVEATEEAQFEPTSSEISESAPPAAAATEDGLAADGEGEAVSQADSAEPDGATDELEGDDDVEPTPIEAAMLAELSEGVSDNTEAFLEGLIESLLFSSDRPMPAKELARAAGIDRRRAEELVAALKQRYETGGLTIEEVAGGYVMRSSPRYSSYIQKLLALRPVRLSRAQLETLAIVAYRQPVTKPEVDDIRGVDSGQVLKGLLERELLKIVGKKDEPGRPMLYGTTTAFLELLNLQSLKDLPTLREYTELSEESRRKFAEETGEAPEGAPSDEAGAGQGDAASEAPPEPGVVTQEGEALADDGEVAVAPEPDALEPEAVRGADEAEVATDDDASELGERDEADPEGVADAAEPVGSRALHDEAEEGIDLDLLGDAGELEDEEAPASRG